ncbi:hypothetical protein IAD21_00560 [Abditibacteriota bacterium]|nr:hypothetical protein IAD21_00560 [Abditibacteriota bacterium]
MAKESIYRAAGIGAGATIIAAFILTRNLGCAPFAPVPVTLTAAPTVALTAIATPTPLPNLVFAGTVTSSASGQAISDADVSVEADDPSGNVGVSLHRKTLSDGTFRFTVKGSIKVVRIKIYAKGFNKFRGEYPLPQTQNEEISIDPIPTSPETPSVTKSQNTPIPPPKPTPPSPSPSITGTFETAGGLGRITFSSNGTYTQSVGGVSGGGTYTVQGNTITVTNNVVPTIVIRDKDHLSFGIYDYERVK